MRTIRCRCGCNTRYVPYAVRLMKVHGIVGKAKKKFKATTNSKHTLPVAENLLNQHFVADKPNTIWISDITYIPTMEGWLYLAVILDLYSRQVVGWAMSDRLTSGFVVKALYQARGRRHPAAGCIFHSDRGIQYASADFRDVLKAYDFIQSMSRKGNCYDNAVAESFSHTLIRQSTCMITATRHGDDFDRQKPIDNFIVDFFCNELMLAIEIDGETHNYKISRDRERQKRIEGMGVQFLRSTDEEIKQNIEGVVAMIEKWLRENGRGTAGRPPTPIPLLAPGESLRRPRGDF